MYIKLNERLIAILVIFAGICTAIVIAPHNKHFLPNFLYYWGPQGIILSILYFGRIHLSVIAGSALIMTLHLIAYDIWISRPSDAMAWLGYLFSIPGALVGALAFGLLMKKYPYKSALFIGLWGSFSTFVGIGMIQLYLCCSVLYCGFKCHIG